MESHGIPWYRGLSALEAHWLCWNIMEHHGTPWTIMMCHGLLWKFVNILEYYWILRNMLECRMSWYHKPLKVPTRPWAAQALLWGYSCIAARGRLRPSHGPSALEAHWTYWNTLKIVEYRGISWNAMKNHDVMVCLGSSLNILEYHWILRNMMEWRMSWYHASLKVP